MRRSWFSLFNLLWWESTTNLKYSNNAPVSITILFLINFFNIFYIPRFFIHFNHEFYTVLVE